MTNQGKALEWLQMAINYIEETLGEKIKDKRRVRETE